MRGLEKKDEELILYSTFGITMTMTSLLPCATSSKYVTESHKTTLSRLVTEAVKIIRDKATPK